MFAAQPWKFMGSDIRSDRCVYDALKPVFSGENSSLVGVVMSYCRPIPRYSTVRVVGLNKAPKYNNLPACVTREEDGKGRITIQFLRDHKLVRIRPENLLVYRQSADRPPPEDVKTSVVVIGAGAAGLAAAYKLMRNGVKNVVVLEGRDRIGGRILTHGFGGSVRESDGKTRNLKQIKADLGANYLHKCWIGDNQPVFALAKKNGARVASASGGSFASTQVAGWFDERTGKPIDPMIVAKCHARHTMHQGYMTRRANETKGNLDVTIGALLRAAQKHVSRRESGTGALTSLEKRIHFKITSRLWGYVSKVEETAADLIRGNNPYKGYEDNPAVCGIRHVAGLAQQMVENVKESESPTVARCSDRLGGVDRLVVDGYTKLVVSHLTKPKPDVRLNKSVCSVQITDPASTSGATMADDAYWSSKDNKTREPSVEVRCRDGSVYRCQYAVCTVPLGVLQSKSPYSSIEWSPPLSPMKAECIRKLGMGVHNKVVLRFREADVFWPAKTPQLLSPDPRFHFLNLNAYGKTGLILAHSWPPYAEKWNGKSDAQVVADCLKVLRGMFRKKAAQLNTPEPVDSVVTRWDTDPFSMGSYSYLGRGSGWNHVKLLNLPHPEMGEPRVFFAGEAASMAGVQCVDGAYESGMRAGKCILKCYGIKSDNE